MIIRDALGGDEGARKLHARLDEILNAEDGVIILMDAKGVTDYYQGFSWSACHLEMLSGEVESRLRELSGERRNAPPLS
jgi:hypothetical protein